MRLLSGTSGFSYKEWVGEFYPDKLPTKEMLRYYATRLPTVEINNTFYRMPNAAAIHGWRDQVPDTFQFAIKAPKRITHSKRLKDCADEIGFLFKALEGLGESFGSLLVQLPPYAKVDTPALASFLGALPKSCRPAFEFRHASWLVPEVYELLQRRNAALVQSEEADGFEPHPWTADWAYLRLRKVDYSERELSRWLERLVAADVQEAQVFFKHEDGATGPKLAERLIALAQAR